MKRKIINQKDQEREEKCPWFKLAFFTCTYNSFVCIVTLMLRRRRREKEQEIISSKGYVILLTCIYTYIYIHAQYTAWSIYFSRFYHRLRHHYPVDDKWHTLSVYYKKQEKRRKMRTVYLVVHSDIRYIVKDNYNKLNLLKLPVEYNNHH